jgi:hypothetical protein
VTAPEQSLPKYKIALFLTRRGTSSAADFTARWLRARPPTTPGLLRYIHNTPAQAAVPIENAPPAPFDGIDELLFASAENARAWLESAAGRGWIETRGDLLATAPLALSGQAWTLWKRPGKPPAHPVKILTLPVRPAGMTMDAFSRHWMEVHAGLALSSPGVVDRLAALVSCPADREPLPGLSLAPFDGIGTILFASQESMAAEFAGSHYREVMAPDEPRFTDPARSRAMMVREATV